MNYIQYMKPGGNFNSSQWDFNAVDKSKLTPEQIKYAVEQYFWRTKDPEMKKQYELWSDYQKRVNASQNIDLTSDIAASDEIPEVIITAPNPLNKTVAVASVKPADLIGTPEKKKIDYRPYKAWQNELDARRAANQTAILLAPAAVPAAMPIIAPAIEAVGAEIVNIPETLKWAFGTQTGRALLGNIGKDMLAGTAGYMIADEASNALTGKTVGQNVADVLGKIGLDKVPYSVRENIGNFANIGGWWTFGGKTGRQLYNSGVKLAKNLYQKFNTKINTQDIYNALAEAVTPFQPTTYGKVKYYGPTMGKTTAAKTNPNLVDFDDIVRNSIAELAAKKGVSVKDLKMAGDADYVALLEAEMARWQANPANKGKTLVVSNKALSNSTVYNNTPSIPDKETFIQRQIQRGGSREEASSYYDALIEHNPNLKIDNRFVSDIEGATSAHPVVSTSTHSTAPDFSSKRPFDLKQAINNIRQSEASALLTNGYKDNFATFIDDLPDPVKHSSIPTSIKEHIETNVVPRLVQQRPWIQPGNVITDVKLNIEGPWYTASRKVFDAAGYDPRVQGIHTPSTGNITIADDVEDLQKFLIHELRHKIDNGIPLTQLEDDLLRAAFGDEFLNIPYAKKNNYDTYNDMVTTIGDARASLFGQGKGMPIEQQNFFIDQVPDNVIINAVADSNGYGKELIQLLQQNKALTPERVKAFREAMKYVGMSALPLLLSPLDTQNYKSGGKLNYLNLMNNVR